MGGVTASSDTENILGTMLSVTKASIASESDQDASVGRRDLCSAGVLPCAHCRGGRGVGLGCAGGQQHVTTHNLRL